MLSTLSNTQYGRPSVTKNCNVQLIKRGNAQLWDIALIKSFFWFPFNNKEYVFAKVQQFTKLPPYVDKETGFKIISQDPVGEIVIIPAQTIEQKVVLLKFSDLLPGFHNRKVTLALSDYK